MTEPTTAWRDYVSKMGVNLDSDFLGDSIVLLRRLLMEVQMSEQIGAERYERTEERHTHRRGYRERKWGTRVGTFSAGVHGMAPGVRTPSPPRGALRRTNGAS